MKGSILTADGGGVQLCYSFAIKPNVRFSWIFNQIPATESRKEWQKEKRNNLFPKNILMKLLRIKDNVLFFVFF